MKWTLPASKVKHTYISCSSTMEFSYIQMAFKSNFVTSCTSTKEVGVSYIPPVHKICFRVEFPFRQEPSVMGQWGIPSDPLLWYFWARWRLLLWHREVGALLNAPSLCLISLFPTHWHARTWMEIHTPMNECTCKHAQTHTHARAHRLLIL